MGPSYAADAAMAGTATYDLPMLLGIDHLVLAVRDPDSAAAELERDTGLAFTGGGRHEHAGTFNRLAFLGDTYVELMGVFDRELVLRSTTFAVGRAALTALDAGREGLVTYALASDDLEAEVARLQTGGSQIGVPVAGSRVRPDGGIVRWLTAFPELGPEEPPFLIEHADAGAEWDPEARAARAAFRHPAGGRVRLARIVLPVADREAAAARYEGAVGVAFDGEYRARVGGQGIELSQSPSVAPLVDLVGDPGSPVLDLVRFGVRWRRAPR